MAYKISLIVLMACLCFIEVFSLVIAVSDNPRQGQQKATDNETTTNETGQGLGVINKTFMQCVSDAAKAKNTCYTTTKDAYAGCKETAKSRQETTKCKTDYKKATKDCKAEFKAKRNECKVLKHNFLDSIRAAFM
jgi:hypothetical protein